MIYELTTLIVLLSQGVYGYTEEELEGFQKRKIKKIHDKLRALGKKGLRTFGRKCDLIPEILAKQPSVDWDINTISEATQEDVDALTATMEATHVHVDSIEGIASKLNRMQIEITAPEYEEKSNSSSGSGTSTPSAFTNTPSTSAEMDMLARVDRPDTLSNASEDFEPSASMEIHERALPKPERRAYTQTEYKKTVEGEVVLAKQHGYSNVKFIANGGCGVAWSAVRDSDNLPVCIKVNRNLKKGKERAAMIKECHHLKRWAQMQIPNVTAYHEHFGETEGQDIEMVLDLVPESKMLQNISRKEFTMVECMTIIRQIATAMACIHVNGWSHADAHTKNIMISYNKRRFSHAILIDWDLAKKSSKKYKLDCRMFTAFVTKVFSLCKEPVDADFIEQCRLNFNTASFGDALIFRYSEVQCWKLNGLNQWVPDREDIDVSEWDIVEQPKRNNGNTTIVQKDGERRLIVTVDTSAMES